MKNTTIDGFSVGVYLSAASGEQATLLNSTIANTTGYGVYINSGDAVVRNMILTGTSYGLLRLAGTTTHPRNLLYGFSTPFSGTSTDDTEVQKDPRFVDSANGDFHLSVGSPEINAGLDVGPFVATDMESNARPSYDAFKMGAYEYMDANGSFRVIDWTEKR